MLHADSFLIYRPWPVGHNTQFILHNSKLMFHYFYIKSHPVTEYFEKTGLLSDYVSRTAENDVLKKCRPKSR